MPTRDQAHESRARFAGRGFTLLEIIVVIVIVAIVGSAAIVSTGSTYRTRQRAATRELAAELIYMRERALATGRAHWARYDLTTHTVTYLHCVSGVASTSAAATAYTDPTTGSQMTTVLNSASSQGQNWDGVRISSVNGSGASPQWIGFDWLGRTLDSAGALRTTAAGLTVTASKGGFGNPATTITVEAETGAVSTTLP
jgi:prepilin-type N-terminal cleavage/methylation domain-containing protein